MGFESVIEGQCPTCGSPLERRDVFGPCGWCPSCKVGYSIRGDERATHFVYDDEHPPGIWHVDQMKLTSKMLPADRIAADYAC